MFYKKRIEALERLAKEQAERIESLEKQINELKVGYIAKVEEKADINQIVDEWLNGAKQ